jgi:hypothetical protein
VSVHVSSRDPDADADSIADAPATDRNPFAAASRGDPAEAAAGGFRLALLPDTHFGPLAIWNAYSILDEEQRMVGWTDVPRWRSENDFQVAYAQANEYSDRSA